MEKCLLLWHLNQLIIYGVAQQIILIVGLQAGDPMYALLLLEILAGGYLIMICS